MQSHARRQLGALLLLGLAAAHGPTALEAQASPPRPGADRSLRQWTDSFPGYLYLEDSLRATVYPASAAGELVDVERRGLRIEGLPDSLRPTPDVSVGVMVLREWSQVGSQTPRLRATRLRYAPELRFRPFQSSLTIETAQAPNGDLRLSVDGERVGQYSNRARYAVVNELIMMRRPWATLRLTVDDRVLWEGRFVAVPERRSRMRFTEGRVEIVSP